MFKTKIPISDAELKLVPVRDNQDRLVHIESIFPSITLDPMAYLGTDGDTYLHLTGMLRSEVVQKLRIAKDSLPEGYGLSLRCGYRPLHIQKRRFEETYEKVRLAHPEWSKEEVYAETSKWVAPLDIVPPHSTGGAVDISLTYQGAIADCGTSLSDKSEASYTYYPDISAVASANRTLLIQAMTQAGFVNYPSEWWHWSYGDQYWAAVLQKPCAIYDSVVLEHEEGHTT